MSYYETFAQLHQNPEPFLLGNIWDVNSAKIFEANNYQAIGISSQALSNSFGYEDGEKLPFDLAIANLKRIVAKASRHYANQDANLWPLECLPRPGETQIE